MTALLIIAALIAAASVIILNNKTLAAKLRGEWAAEVSAAHQRVDAIEARLKAAEEKIGIKL